MTDISTEGSPTVYAAVIDHLGRPVACHAVAADTTGYRQFLAFLTDYGIVAHDGLPPTDHLGFEEARH